MSRGAQGRYLPVRPVMDRMESLGCWIVPQLVPVLRNKTSLSDGDDDYLHGVLLVDLVAIA